MCVWGGGGSSSNDATLIKRRLQAEDNYYNPIRQRRPLGRDEENLIRQHFTNQALGKSEGGLITPHARIIYWPNATRA